MHVDHAQIIGANELAQPDESAVGELPAVTDDQIGAAVSFVAAVGGVKHAARALFASSFKGGGKDAVKETLVEVLRAAHAVLTPSEIAAIVVPCPDAKDLVKKRHPKGEKS
jgi:hypothetical protein